MRSIRHDMNAPELLPVWFSSFAAYWRWWGVFVSTCCVSLAPGFLVFILDSLLKDYSVDYSCIPGLILALLITIMSCLVRTWCNPRSYQLQFRTFDQNRIFAGISAEWCIFDQSFSACVSCGYESVWWWCVLCVSSIISWMMSTSPALCFCLSSSRLWSASSTCSSCHSTYSRASLHHTGCWSSTQIHSVEHPLLLFTGLVTPVKANLNKW